MNEKPPLTDNSSVKLVMRCLITFIWSPHVALDLSPHHSNFTKQSFFFFLQYLQGGQGYLSECHQQMFSDRQIGEDLPSCHMTVFTSSWKREEAKDQAEVVKSKPKSSQSCIHSASEIGEPSRLLFFVRFVFLIVSFLIIF